MREQEYKDLYNDFKFLALVPAKISTGIGVLVFIYFLFLNCQIKCNS